jgi:GT2 family glycosyltransferase
MKAAQIALMILTKDAPQSTIQAVRSSRLPQGQVIVVSNGSCAEADAELGKALPGIHLVKLHPNRGISYCWNIGVRLPAEQKWPVQPRWTILANDDVEFDADWLAKLGAGVAKHPNVRHIAMAYPKNRYSCFAVHRDLIRKVGWFDERYMGMFYEDDDWHLRLCEYAKCPAGERVHEKEKSGVFRIVECVLHDHALNKARTKDRARFKFTATLRKEPNKKFFYEKWAVVKKGGWQGKGLPGLFARRLPEVEWHPMALLGGALK